MKQPTFPFQEMMVSRMKKEKWTQQSVADYVSEKVGRTVHPSAINRLLNPIPVIPSGDVLNAIAQRFEQDPRDFALSVYASRYSTGDLSKMSDFVRESFESADEATQRRIIEILRNRQ